MAEWGLLYPPPSTPGSSIARTPIPFRQTDPKVDSLGGCVGITFVIAIITLGSFWIDRIVIHYVAPSCNQHLQLLDFVWHNMPWDQNLLYRL